MELINAIKKRRSIRMFLQKQVARKTIEEIVEQALWAPSWGNTQPWEIIAADGPLLEEYKKRNRDALISGKKSVPDIATPLLQLTARYKEVGKSVLGALSIERGDQERRIKYYSDMNSLFDAPVLLLFAVHKELNLEYAILDCGLLLQNICLLAIEKGLGTCLLAASINYPEIAHELFSIPDDRRLIIGMGIGWPDSESRINNFDRTRAPLDQFLRWVGK
jgi:nitroreductase